MQRGEARRQITGWQQAHTKSEWAERVVELEERIKVAMHEIEQDQEAEAYLTLKHAFKPK